MNDPLSPLLADGVIDEVVARLKSGKEADLWLVRHAGELLAAKVYKAREARNFRNNSAYKEGREVRDTRTRRAMARGSRFGQAAAEEAWKSREADALYKLHAAGVHVPQPVMFYEGVLLMEVVVDADGRPAPRLIDAHIRPEDAAALYADLRAQAVRMLACDLIHGDLSPYNVLVGHAGPVVIDFPQVVGAAHNSQAERFFLRDVENLHRFFAALDPDLQRAAGDGREIWHAYVRRELTADFVPTGRSPEPPRRAEHRPPAAAPRASAVPSPRAPPAARGGSPRPVAPVRFQPQERGRGQQGARGPQVIHVSRPDGAPSGPRHPPQAPASPEMHRAAHHPPQGAAHGQPQRPLPMQAPLAPARGALHGLPQHPPYASPAAVHARPQGPIQAQPRAQPPARGQPQAQPHVPPKAHGSGPGAERGQPQAPHNGQSRGAPQDQARGQPRARDRERPPHDPAPGASHGARPGPPPSSPPGGNAPGSPGGRRRRRRKRSHGGRPPGG